MKFLFTILVLAFATVGCVRAPHPVEELVTSERVAKVLLARHVYEEDGSSRLQTFAVQIDDAKTVEALCDAVALANLSSDYAYTWAGVLSFQVFLDKKDRILAVCHIVNSDCLVVFGEGFRRRGNIYLHPGRNRRLPPRTGGRAPEYCRIVYEFMKARMPEEIARQNKYYADTPVETLERSLFGEEH